MPGKKPCADEQRPELANLVEEQIRVPVLAIELVAFDVGKHPMRERDHLVVGRAILIRVQQFPIALDELLRSACSRSIGRSSESPDFTRLIYSGRQANGIDRSSFQAR